MWDTALNVIIWTVAGYLVIGNLLAWKWLLEARIKCVDMKDPLWSEFLNTLQGIMSFTILATTFWLPALISNIASRHRRKKKRVSKLRMTWMQSFQRAIELYQQLQAWRRNEIE